MRSSHQMLFDELLFDNVEHAKIVHDATFSWRLNRITLVPPYMTWIHHCNYNDYNYISITVKRIPITFKPFVKTICFETDMIFFFNMLMLYVLHNRARRKTSTVVRFNVRNTDAGNVANQNMKSEVKNWQRHRGCAKKVWNNDW